MTEVDIDISLVKVQSKTCDICGRAFTRKEHLERHRRTHTKERPFNCPLCGISFPRGDVRDKHVKRCNGSNDGQPGDETHSGRSSAVRHPRSRLACDGCRKKKLKCDNVHPCGACASKNLLCTTSSTSKRPGRPRHGLLSPPLVYNSNSMIDDGEVGSIQGPDPDITESIGMNGHRLLTEHTSIEYDGSMLPATSLQSHHAHHNNWGSNAASLPDVPEMGVFGTGDEDFDFMSGLWQLPLTDMESTGDDFSLPIGDETWLQPPQREELQSDQPLSMMRDYFRARSRASTPTRIEAGQHQYSVAPRLQIYDTEIINVFLNLARDHLSCSFPIFSAFKATSGMRKELCLAMASVGGLYCRVQGSTKVAKALYHDSRRLLLESHFSERAMHFETVLSFAKTFMLLEIYGLCSGDKRSYEFVEVFHGCMLDVIKQYTLHPAAQTDQVSSLNDATRTLESYRVLFLLLPPSITTTVDTTRDQNLRQLLTPGDSTIESVVPSIAALSSLAWMAGASHRPDRKVQLWRSEFIELALDRWIRSGDPETQQLPQILLYHMTHIFLHSDLVALQRFAMGFATSDQQDSIPEAIHTWAKSRDFAIAKWHASKILTPAKKAVIAAHTRSRDQGKSNQTEPPHLPYCIYFAVLVGWYEGLISGRNEARETSISEGAQLLLGMRVRVARLLGTALYELLPERARIAE